MEPTNRVYLCVAFEEVEMKGTFDKLLVQLQNATRCRDSCS